MIETPKFSVIVNCLNGSRFLESALDSVYQQTWSDWEIIFYDNASSENYEGILAKYDNRLKYFRSKKTVLLGSARNNAASKAKGDYLAFLDCDDLWMQRKLELQHEVIKSRRYKVCATGSLRINSLGITLAHYSDGRDRFSSGDARSAIVQDCFISMSSSVIDRELFTFIGGFNPTWNFVEDWDLWCRAAHHTQFINLEDTLTKIRYHEGNTSRDIQAQKDEHIRFIKTVLIADDMDLDRDNLLFNWKFRFSVSEFIVSLKKCELQTFLRLFFVISNIARRPMLSYKFLRKYFSLTTLKFILVKFR